MFNNKITLRVTSCNIAEATFNLEQNQTNVKQIPNIEQNWIPKYYSQNDQILHQIRKDVKKY